jgi:hypothetical protein
MPRVKSSSKTEDINPDYVRMYYEHQYERIKKHEEQALTISNIVLTASALIITFGLNNRQSFGPVLILFLPAIIIVVNIFSIFYIRNRSRYISMHRTRAKLILKTYIPELYILDSETAARDMERAIGRREFQYLIHILFVAIAAILTILFTLEMLGASIM